MNHLRICLSAFIILFSSASFARTGDLCSHARTLKGGGISPLWVDGPPRPYTVLKYQLTLDWRNIFITKTPAFTAVNQITLILTKATPSIELDATHMQIDSISINNTPITPIPQPASEKLLIPLPAQFRDSGAQFTVTIGYSRDAANNIGMYFFPKGFFVGKLPKGDSAIVEEDLAYTMSEPTDAHNWMPCNDRPSNKAQSEISIIVPDGIETASNGALISKNAYTASSTIWHWKSDEPIATYLMVADASTFIHWSETHHSSPAPEDTVHLDYYAWPKDYGQDSITDGSEYNATYYLSRPTSDIMSILESHYGRFPFIKYGQVPVQPFYYGGMEHQTLTTINRAWIRQQTYSGIAHEMAHQWFGDKTTCESFKDIWLNEGFASYSEAVYNESWGKNVWYMITVRGKADDYFKNAPLPERPIYDPPDSDVFSGPMTYSKGACVLHMLRRMVGDTMFFDALRDYSNTFAYSTANSMQLRDYLGSRLGLDLFDYFDQWIFGAGHPEYDISWGQNPANLLSVRVNQYQSFRDHFTMPMKFIAYHGVSIDTFEFENNARSQLFQKVLNYTIDSLRLDNDALVLSTYITAPGDTVNASVDDTNRILRLPFAPALSVQGNNSAQHALNIYHEASAIICTFAPAVQNGTIELYNSLGMQLMNFPILAGETMKRFEIHGLASGAYFIRLAQGVTSEVKSVSIVR